MEQPYTPYMDDDSYIFVSYHYKGSDLVFGELLRLKNQSINYGLMKALKLASNGSLFGSTIIGVTGLYVIVVASNGLLLGSIPETQ